MEPPVPAAPAEDFVAPVTHFQGDHDLGLDKVEKNGRRKAAWKRPIGLALLGAVILLWTLTNFLASTIMADDSYSKPYFVTYINTSFFILPLIPMLVAKSYRNPKEMGRWRQGIASKVRGTYALLGQDDEGGQGHNEVANTRRASITSQSTEMGESMESSKNQLLPPSSPPPLTLMETAKLSLEFCMLWFLANYFVSACLQYTTVASSTILTSTSPLFTLIFGAMFRVEKFTLRKVIGVMASLAGVALISSIDLSGENSDDEHRGKFPQKSIHQLAIGDLLALMSAVLYGLYSVFMKKRIADEDRVNMIVFMGLVGVINVLILWPGIILFHYAGVETFELPHTGRVVAIIFGNSLGSMVSDFAWAYAVLFTSPILVTVGLTMTIPLSLIGQIVLNNQTVGWLYWVGALIVVFSFFIVFTNEEADKEIPALHVQPDSERRAGHGHAS